MENLTFTYLGRDVTGPELWDVQFPNGYARVEYVYHKRADIVYMSYAGPRNEMPAREMLAAAFIDHVWPAR